MDIQKQLQNARDRLRALGDGINRLVDDFPEAFADALVQEQLADFRRAHQESTERLANPRLVIATLGTTSAGKSTIVNALIGRRLAPIEAGEMSGGVLRLVHSEERRLAIAKTADAAWETGTWENPTDREVYERVQSVMSCYHQARKRKDLMAPQVEVWAPLLPACDPSLSGLPAGLGVEFLDLPGLKSVQDRANLAVIQPQVGKAFSLVALDYLQVDEQHRQKLLAELKEVVQYLQGRTESMIFILNRVDARGGDDWPLEKRLQVLKQEIQETLGLRQLPDIIPFSARLLYYAQCAWGPRSLDGASTTAKAEQIELLKNLFKDCASLIKEKQRPYPDLKQRLREIEDRVDETLPIDDLPLKGLVRCALEWSGGTDLWKCIRRRLGESCADLVIVPALLPTLSRFDALMASLNVVIDNRTQENEQAIQEARENLVHIREELVTQVREKGAEFKKKIEKVVAVEDPKEFARVVKEVGEGFQEISETINQVEGDLTNKLIAKVRDAFQKNQSAYELEESLQAVVSPSCAKDVARAYDNASRSVSQFLMDGDFWICKVRADDNAEKQKLERAEKHIRLLYYTVRCAVQQRAAFLLQANVQNFEEPLNAIVEEELSSVGQRLAALGGSSDARSIVEGALSSLKAKLLDSPVQLPEEVFQFEEPVAKGKKTQREVVGQEEYIGYYTTGSCWKETHSEIRVRDVYGDVEYVTLSLPTPKLMGRHWVDSIAKAKDELWEVLLDCLAERLQVVEEVFEESLDETVGLANRTLDAQWQAIQADFEANQKHWQSFAEHCTMVREVFEVLKKGE